METFSLVMFYLSILSFLLLHFSIYRFGIQRVEKYVRKHLRKIFGFCDMCNRPHKYPKRRHMNTAYLDDESNYCKVCKDCFDEIEEYWQERWDEYNSGRY